MYMLALIGKAESAYKLTSGLVGRNLFLVCLKVTRSNSTPPPKWDAGPLQGYPQALN